MGNGRLRALDLVRRSVTFAYKDYAGGGAARTMPLGLDEFTRRLRRRRA